MTSVRPQDLSFMAGGAVAQRHGVFVRRTSPREDVAEIFARSTAAPRFDENGVVRNAAIDVPRLSWRDFDGDGVYEQAVLPIAPQTTNLIEFNVPGGVPSDFELSPVTVTNQTAEYYVEIDEGDNLQVTAPATLDLDDALVGVWARPSWPNTDGVAHYFLTLYIDSNNRITLSKWTDDTIIVSSVLGGVAKNATLTLPFSAGDEVFVGFRTSGGTLTLYADTDADNTLETAAIGGLGTSAGGSALLYVGADPAGSYFDGGLNIAILDGGSSADPITERFNAGDGLDIQEWLETYGEQLVLYLPKSKDGEEVEKITYAGATQLFATGNVYQLDLPGAAGDFASCPDHDALDLSGDPAIIVCAFLDDVTPAGDTTLVAKFNGAERAYMLQVDTVGKLQYVWSEDGINPQLAISTAVAPFTNGTGFWAKVEHDLDDGAADSTIDFFTSSDPITTAPADVTWTKLGATVLHGSTTSINVGTSVLEFGGYTSGAAGEMAGAIFVAQVYDGGVAGTLVLDADFRYLDGGETVVLSQDIYSHPITKQGNATFADSGTDISSGKFERYVKSGRYVFSDSTEYIRFGNTAEFDGAAKVSMMWEVEIGATADNQPLFMSDSGGIPSSSLAATLNVGTHLIAYIDSNANWERQAFGTPKVAGDRLLIGMAVDLTQAARDRVLWYEAAYDPAMGQYAAWTELTGAKSGGGTVPATIPNEAGIHQIGGALWEGKIDDFRWKVGVAHDFTATTPTVYEADPSEWDHYYPMDGDADDAIGSVDGVVTGAIQWYDGRQPEDWTFANGAVDRATTSQEGTYALRVVPKTNAAVVYQLGSITEGKWYFGGGHIKAQTSSARSRSTHDSRLNLGINTTSGLGSFEDQVGVGQATATHGATGIQFDTGTADADYFHLDDARFFEFAEPAWDTATKGDAIPGIDGLGGPWGIADASSVVASSEGIPLPYDIDYGTTVMKLESGPAGSGTRRYLFGLPGSMNDFTADTLAGMVIGVYIPSSSEITPAQVTTHAVDDQGSSAGDVATANDRWQWLWATRTWDAGATEAYFELRFADGVSLSGADEVLFMAIPTGASGTVPLVPIPQITEGTSVVEEEDFYTAFEIPPGAAGFYVELVAWAPGGLLYIGAAGDTGARLMLEYATDGTLLIFFSDGSSTSQKASVSTVSPGSNIKVLGTVTAAGALQLTISIDDAAEEESAVAAALELPDDWGAKRVYLGSKGGGDHATVEILDAKVVRDSTYTLAGVGAVT